MLDLPFNEDQRDCLQEVTNVAMGAAGESLANFTQTFVHLSIPKIRYLNSGEMLEGLQCLEQEDGVSAVVQPFLANDQQGYALVVISEASFSDLAQFTGRWTDNEAVAQELLKDLAKTINETCLSYLGEMLEMTLQQQDAEVVALHVPFKDLALKQVDSWKHLVSVEINYHLEAHPFNCDLLLLLPDEALSSLIAVLNGLLED